MSELFETKVLIGYNNLQARINELKELGWVIDDDFDELEFTDEINAWVVKLKRSIYQKANHEPPFTALLVNVTKEQWEKALTEYKANEWRTKPTFVTITEKEPIVFSWDIPQEKESREGLVDTLKNVYKKLGWNYDFIHQASQEQADYDQLVNNIIAISDLDRDEFLEDFEKWYKMLDVGTPKHIYLEFIYGHLAMGNGLPWKYNDNLR